VPVLVDVSGSMTNRDEQPGPGVDVTTLPTRQDKVIELLTTAYNLDKKDKTFVEHILRKSPVVFYRFGGVLDKEPVFFTPDGKKVCNKEQFASWLKPDKKQIQVAGKDYEESAKLRSEMDSMT